MKFIKIDKQYYSQDKFHKFYCRVSVENPKKVVLLSASDKYGQATLFHILHDTGHKVTERMIRKIELKIVDFLANNHGSWLNLNEDVVGIITKQVGIDIEEEDKRIKAIQAKFDSKQKEKPKEKGKKPPKDKKL